MRFDREHVASGVIEDGFYAVVDDAAPHGVWVFRVKSRPTNRRPTYAWQRDTRQVALARHPNARTFFVFGDIDGSDVNINLSYLIPERQRAFEAALRRLLSSDDAREDMGKVYALRFGRCRACGRKLTHPDSVETGIGPECAGTRRHVEVGPASPPLW